MARKNRKSVTFLTLFSLLISLALTSCKTVPRVHDVIRDGRLPLEPGAYAYLFAGKEALPIVGQLMFNNIDNNQFQQMIDLTSFAAAAIYLIPGAKAGTSATRYRLAAWGSYPSSRAKVALGSSREWQKRRSAVANADYWYSSQSGYSIALTGRRALVATAAKNEDAPDPYCAAPGTALPEGFAAFREGSILSCWLDNPGPAINQKLKEMKIPIEIPAQRILVGLVPADKPSADGQSPRAAGQPSADGRYTARVQIQLPTVSQARAIAIMFSFARNMLPPKSELGILFANPPVQEGGNLNIATSPLTAREITLLLNVFLVK